MAFQQLHDPGLLFVMAMLNKDQSLDAARDAIVKALDDIVKSPPSPEEIENARTQLLRGLQNSLSDPQAIATGALTAAISQGDWRLMFLRHDRLSDVSVADVVRVAKAYLKPSNRTVGYYTPDLNPDRTVVQPVVDLARTLNNYQSAMTTTRAESFDPTIANISSRIARSRLANGMRIAVLSKKTANNMVTATINLRFGDATTLANQRTSALFAANLIMQGTKTHTRQQLQDEFRKLNAQVTVALGIGGGQRGAPSAGQSLTNNVTASTYGAGRKFSGCCPSGGRNSQGTGLCAG